MSNRDEIAELLTLFQQHLIAGGRKPDWADLYNRAGKALASLQSDPKEMAKRFHEAYERLAPRFGYETRPETREFDPVSPNGKLMVAVCSELLAPPERVEEVEADAFRDGFLLACTWGEPVTQDIESPAFQHALDAYLSGYAIGPTKRIVQPTGEESKS